MCALERSQMLCQRIALPVKPLSKPPVDALPGSFPFVHRVLYDSSYTGSQGKAMSKQRLILPDPPPLDEDALLEIDERWSAVQRILASSGFQRAGQLRKILTYLTTAVILRPEQTVREYEIACEVLGRRSDFDPLDDNIVRQQMSHLRRKLDTYYREEGRNDPWRLTIPKGSYLPQFAEVRRPLDPGPTDPSPGFAGGVVSVGTILEGSGSSPATLSKVSTLPHRGLLLSLSIACLVMLVTIALLLRRVSDANASRAAAPVAGNSFVQFLAHLSGPVKIVLPDLSLVILQHQFDASLNLQEYARPDYLQSHIDLVKDPDFNYLLSTIRNMRNTSYDEAVVGMDIQKVLDINSVSNSTSFAREISIRDVSEGTSVLIGSYRSNPLAGLFKDQLNYRFQEDPATKDCYFSNQHPAPGEPSRYFVYTLDRSKWVGRRTDMDSYADIAFVPNLTHSGYVLLLDGSDNEATVAATRFLMHGKLPPSIDNVLRKNDLSYFELFFHGSHIDNQDEAKFELLSVRSEAGK